MKRWLLLLMALSHAVAAQSSWGGGVDPLHMWNAHIVFSETHTLHFQLEVLADQDLPGGKSIAILNGDERFPLTYRGYDKSREVWIWDFPFQASFALMDDDHKGGDFIKTETGEHFPFTAEPASVYEGDAPVLHKRFPEDDFGSTHFNSPTHPLAERYDLRLSAGQDNEVHAVGEFYTDVTSGEIRGSILTQTGDYRYLAGNRYGNRVWLSTFDGIHSYTFCMDISADGHVAGTHYSGATYREDFTGIPNADASLDNPYNITSALVPGLDITLPDYATGVAVQIRTGQGRVTLVQVMGSWCPNCLDESAFFKELAESHDGLDIYALAFERSDNREVAKPAIARVATYLDLPYPILFAGKAERGAVEKVLPIENFISYPTYLLYDRQGKLVEVHAGFSGPATSGWKAYSEGMHMTLQQLLEPQL